MSYHQKSLSHKKKIRLNLEAGNPLLWCLHSQNGKIWFPNNLGRMNFPVEPCGCRTHSIERPTRSAHSRCNPRWQYLHLRD